MEEVAPDSQRSHRVAFIGLGVMGYPMAGHLAQAGHAVTVFNRTGERSELWVRASRDTGVPDCRRRPTG